MASKPTQQLQGKFPGKSPAREQHRSKKKNLSLRHGRGQVTGGLTHIPCEEGHLCKNRVGSKMEFSKVAF